ncbi:hypothetical protein E1B28_004226 [Marasmius oreades]|uniref:GH18 domain-containing protein n=1 Tax=Marasmius oreades TaxID=181124 RepID=A0A9P7UY80_9AGAR|nr:uncharacterized protein E1B28_004226 [Marasmius oreades]KAG7096817.1 hypothetical protein E1B28_004226 [Marasmius oreades]
MRFLDLYIVHLASFGVLQAISTSSIISSTPAVLSEQSGSTSSSSSSSNQTPSSSFTSAITPNSTQSPTPSFNNTSLEMNQWSVHDNEAVFNVPKIEITALNGDELFVTTDLYLVMAYYSSWLSDILPPDEIDYSRFDIVFYAFIIPDSSHNLGFAGESPDVLTQLVDHAHKHEKKVLISIGGWTGSAHFSSAVENEEQRRLFANNIDDFYRKYNLDGIDIDWEYPGRQGDPGNELDSSDSANFLEFLKLLRSVLPPNAKITAAATTLPFAGPAGQPMEDVSEFANVLDWVLLMNYDTWGTTSNPGPNAPLSDTCNNSTQSASSAAAGFNAWTNAGFPARQLVLGLPSYGYISESTQTHLRTRSDGPSVSDSDDFTRLKIPEGGDQGSVSVREMVKQGALVQNGSELTAAGGFTSEWDECSSTPFLRSQKAKQVVPFDNARSIGMKAEFVRRTRMRGVNFFDLQGDTNSYVLVDAARRVLGRC